MAPDTIVTVLGMSMRTEQDQTVTADIQAGERRLLEYVLGPMLRYRDESLGER